MVDFDDFSDNEFKNPRTISSATTKRRKGKVIQLDDLIEELENEKKLAKKESKRAKRLKKYDSDDDKDDDVRETIFNKSVAQIQKDMSLISGDDKMPIWGIQVFRDQKTWPFIGFPDTGRCELLQSFKDHELNSYVKLDAEKGEIFLEGLLTSGWLLKLVYLSGRLEESVAKWTLKLLLYSSKEVLRSAACSFWSSILSKSEADQSSIKFEWLPCYSELKKALERYGFQLDSPLEVSSDVRMCTDSDSLGPPQNIRCWIKFADVCCQMRSTWQLLSTLDAEDLIIVITSMFLDRRLLGLSVLLYQCMISAINFFLDDEWAMSLLRIAKSLASRLSTDVNCLRLVESITGSNARGKDLRSAVAFQFLLSCRSEKLTLELPDQQDILRWLISLNLKDKDCDFFKVYICLSLAENWIVYGSLVEDKHLLQEMWRVFLQNCSCHITSTDLRPFAAKVRSKASYLLQGTFSK